MSLDRRRKLLKGILEALAYLQKEGIAHRDLRPENIIVTKNDVPKIIDFGLATSTRSEDHIYTRCGSPGFIAPEIIGH